ncbi:MAG: glycosyltransferase family 9 protein [Desulfovibrio sp.]|nr:glycosyltransferase family 9 protein [Desulfovibrio sp.]
MPPDCLVINLTRFGDLIQSQPLFHDLHARKLSCGLICQENFVKAVPLLCHVEQVWSFPGPALLRELDQNWHLALRHLSEWVREVESQSQAPFLLNLTSTISARLLTRLFANENRKIVGFGLDSEGFGHNEGFWSTFLASTSARRENAVFNIADMFRMMARPLFTDQQSRAFTSASLRPPKSSDLDFANALLTGIQHPARTQPKAFVAFQLGASSPKRQWPVAFFAKLGEALWQRAGICPVLTGSASEEALAQDYASRTQTPYVSAIGKTSWPRLAALLTCVRLLVTNDTGTLHLASGMQTPSLSFFLATAQPWDTGPILPNCLALEPNLACHPCAFGQHCTQSIRCLETIRPEPVADLIIHYLKGSSWEESVRQTANLQARVWLSLREADGLAGLKALGPHAQSDRTLWICHQRNFWRQFLDALTSDTPNKPVYPKLSGLSADFAQELESALQPALHILDALVQQGRLVGKSAQAGTLFLRNCDRLQTLLNTHSAIKSLGYFWHELRSDYGQNLERLLAAAQIFALHLQALRDNLISGTDYA